MVYALPVRYRKGGTFTLIQALRLQEGSSFQVEPSARGHIYVKDLKLAGRRGTLRVVKEILKSRAAPKAER